MLSRRRSLGRWFVLVLILILQGAATAVYLAGGQTLGAASRGGVVGVDVMHAADGATFTIRAGAGPEAAIAGTAPLGNAFEIIPSRDPGDKAVVRFRVDRSFVPGSTPACATPTTSVNMGIAVFDTLLKVWLPLPTTCTGDVLEAVAPHFSWFQAFVLKPGRHVIQVGLGNVARTVEMVSDATTSITLYVTGILEKVLVAIMRNGLGIFDPAKYVCSPPATSHTAAIQDRLLQLAEACTVAGSAGDQLHVKNGYAYPVSFDMTGTAATSLIRIDAGEAFDVLVAGEQFAATMFGKSLLTGLTQGVFNITASAPAAFTFSGDFDEAAWTADIGLATITVLLTLNGTTAAAVELKLILQALGQRVAASGARTVPEILRILADVIKKKPSWAAYAGATQSIIEAINCAGNVRQGEPTDIAVACLSVAKASDSALTEILVTAATQAKAIPEYVQGRLAAAVKLTGLTRIDVTVTGRRQMSGLPLWLQRLSENPILPGIGLAGARLGQAESAVVAWLGQPTSVFPVTSDTGKVLYQATTYQFEGIFLGFYSNADTGTVWSIRLYDSAFNDQGMIPSVRSTAGIGATVTQLTDFMGKPQSTQEHFTCPQAVGDVKTVTYSYSGIEFWVCTNQRVYLESKALTLPG